MSARLHLRLALPLAALLLAPAAARAQRAQATASIPVRATVASARAPRLEISLAQAPVVAAARRAGATAAGDGRVEVTSAVRVAGNAGYRLFVRARAGAESAGLAVRDASGTFRPLAEGESVEVARGDGRGAVREIVYRTRADGPAEPPVVYELVYDPVS